MLRVKLQTHLIETTVSAKTEQSPSTTCETGKLTCDADRRDDSLLHSTSSYQSDAVLDRCPLKTYRLNFGSLQALQEILSACLRSKTVN